MYLLPDNQDLSDIDIDTEFAWKFRLNLAYHINVLVCSAFAQTLPAKIMKPDHKDY